MSPVARPFYQFPKGLWKHLRTTNTVESPFAALILKADAAKRYRNAENATAVIWKMLMLAEHRFPRLDATEKLELVYLCIDLQGRFKKLNGRRYLLSLNLSTDLLTRPLKVEAGCLPSPPHPGH